MEQARRITVPTAEGTGRGRLSADDAAQIARLEKVLHVAFPSRDQATAEADGPRLAGRDINGAIDRLRAAAHEMRANEDRARDAEARMQELVQRATEELKAADSRVQAAENRVRLAEAKVEEAEGRRRTAEEWLGRIFEVIDDELPGRPRS